MTTRPPRAFSALLTLFCRDEVGREIRADLAEEFDDLVKRVGPLAARAWYRRQALRSVLARTVSHASRLVSRLGGSLSLVRAPDIRLAVRSLRHAPWYAATIVAVVALSIALAATVFAVVDGLLFKPLPYADPDRLVRIEPRSGRAPETRSGSISPEDIDGWQSAMPDIPLSALRVESATGLERLNESALGLALVRPNLLETLGVRPLLGGFSADDLAPQRVPRPALRPVLITYDLWRTRFDGDPAIVGRTVQPVDPTAASIRVAGVLPRNFVVPAARPAQLMMPAPLRHAQSWRDTVLLARLPDGVTIEAFRGRIEAAMGQWVAIATGPHDCPIARK